MVPSILQGGPPRCSSLSRILSCGVLFSKIFRSSEVLFSYFFFHLRFQYSQVFVIFLLSKHSEMFLPLFLFFHMLSFFISSSFSFLACCSFCLIQIPVFRGCGHALVTQPDHGDNYFGKDGFGDCETLPDPDKDLLQSEHAVSAMLRLVKENPG